MIPLGYMAKPISPGLDWLQNDRVEEILSVASHISDDFANWINFWKHNGYWFFDSPEIIAELIKEHAIPTDGLRWFYYEGYELEYDEDEKTWSSFQPEPSFPLAVIPPKESCLMGFDVVTYSHGNSAECSPLSCNGLAAEIEVNRHCLLPSLDIARNAIDDGRFGNSEPGPFRIVAVYEIPAPALS